MPSSAAPDVSVQVIIYGYFFQPGAAPYLGNAQLQNIEYLEPEPPPSNRSRIRGTLPASLPLGSYDVTVINPGGRTGMLPGGFTIVPNSTSTATSTRTSTPTSTPTQMPTPTPTGTPAPTATSTATTTASPTPTPTHTATATPTSTPTSAGTTTPTYSPTPTPTFTRTPTPTATGTPTGGLAIQVTDALTDTNNRQRMGFVPRDNVRFWLTLTNNRSTALEGQLPVQS